MERSIQTDYSAIHSHARARGKPRMIHKIRFPFTTQFSLRESVQEDFQCFSFFSTFHWIINCLSSSGQSARNLDSRARTWEQKLKIDRHKCLKCMGKMPGVLRELLCRLEVLRRSVCLKEFSSCSCLSAYLEPGVVANTVQTSINSEIELLHSDTISFHISFPSLLTFGF